MSRANPVGLRIASKKLNSSFIGVSQYYSYNQLKYNIVISKSIQLLSKQLLVPTYQIIDRLNSEKKNNKTQLLYPNILPINTRLKAKQLFDSQFVLNKRRLYSVSIYITRILKQHFEDNYNDFINNHSIKTYFNNTKNEYSALNVLGMNSNKHKKWKFTKFRFYSLTPSITFARECLRIFQKQDLYNIKKNINNQNKIFYRKKEKTKQFQKLKQNQYLNTIFLTKNSDPYLILTYAIPFSKDYYFITKQKLKQFCLLSKIKNTWFNNKVYNIKLPSYSFFFQYLINQHKKSTFEPYLEWPFPSAFSPIIEFKNIIHLKNSLSSIVIKTKTENRLRIKKEKQTDFKDFLKKKNYSIPNLNFFLSKNKDYTLLTLRELYNKPETNYQILKKITVLNFLSQRNSSGVLCQCFLKYKKEYKPIIAAPLALTKEISNKQRRLYINSITINKEKSFAKNVEKTHKISYTLYPRSNVAIFNLKNITKLTKQIEDFRSDIKLLAPLGLLLHRSFSEPVSINCISALEHPLGKTYSNRFLKNLLFRRTSNNYLKSNYMNILTELLRAKDTILFDFAYTKDSLIKLGLKKTNSFFQQQLETGHTKLWLRKVSTIRL